MNEILKLKLKRLLCIICICAAGIAVLTLPQNSRATEYSSSSFEVHDPVLDGGTDSTSSASFLLKQSINQPAIGRSTSSNFQLWGGFQYYYTVLANTVTATAGSSQVQLSWTAPQTFLGATVSSYEVGTGTSSGVYSFEAVGNVTSFTKSSLTNGTPYFFKVKALASGGTFLVFSNEATATPTGGSSGGGGGYSTGSINLSGFAAPGSTVHVLVDGRERNTTQTNSSGNFSATLNITQGPARINLFYVDTQGRPSGWHTLNPIIGSQNEGITNIVLPPIVTVTPQVTHLGDEVKIHGVSAPNMAISITITNRKITRLVSTTSDTQGNWTTNFITNTLSKDAYSVTATSRINGHTSQSSLAANLWIDVPPDIPPIAGVGKCGDYNKDGRINIIDFSILIYWFGRENPPPHIDCNSDNKADLIDFSVLMYYWTG